jgi:hypothetical protein
MNGIRDDVLKWFGSGQVGASSKALACCLAEIDGPIDHPHDPDDFNRCLLLIHDYPELRAFIPKARRLSRVWERIVARWDDIERSFIEEVGLDWCKGHAAPKTYALMRNIIEAAP